MRLLGRVQRALDSAVVPEEMRPYVGGADQFWLSQNPFEGGCYITFCRWSDRARVDIDVAESDLEDADFDIWSVIQPQVKLAFETVDAIVEMGE